MKLQASKQELLLTPSVERGFFVIQEAPRRSAFTIAHMLTIEKVDRDDIDGINEGNSAAIAKYIRRVNGALGTFVTGNSFRTLNIEGDFTGASTQGGIFVETQPFGLEEILTDEPLSGDDALKWTTARYDALMAERQPDPGSQKRPIESVITTL